MPGAAMKHETTRLFRYGEGSPAPSALHVDGSCSAGLSPHLAGVCTPYRYRLSMTATRYHVPVPEGGETHMPYNPVPYALQRALIINGPQN